MVIENRPRSFTAPAIKAGSPDVSLASLHILLCDHCPLFCWNHAMKERPEIGLFLTVFSRHFAGKSLHNRILRQRLQTFPRIAILFTNN
ncbi:MAG TPA: hypothetical protein VK731_00105 [Candidatus Cybelea sp.]|jgi:hypothetical protein|nr:hypothetical protein [Candidatus Cybelea sp.]